MKFSVLIPVYIKENPEYFVQALDSIMGQSVQAEEILIVVDGPLTQALESVIAKYKKAHPELFTILQLEKNMGMGYAMDKGLRACRNSWIARMDSDDIAVPYRFERQIEYLNAHPDTDIVGAIIEEFESIPGDLMRMRRVPENHDEITEFMKSRSPMNHMTVFFRKDVALAAGSYWHRRMLEDYHLWYQMLRMNAVFHNLQDVLVHARVGNDMIGRRRGKAYIKEDRHFFRIMRNDGFLTAGEYYQNVIARIVLRALPKKLLLFVYKSLLRK